MVGRFPASRAAGFLSAAVVLVHRCPSPSLGLLLGDAPSLIALGNVVGLAYFYLSPRGMISLR
jgi:hypothetical protein